MAQNHDHQYQITRQGRQHRHELPPNQTTTNRYTSQSTKLNIALDLTAAFDNVDHQQLLDYFYNTNIPATI